MSAQQAFEAWRDLVDAAKTIEQLLTKGTPAAMVLDENSPTRDALRDGIRAFESAQQAPVSAEALDANAGFIPWSESRAQVVPAEPVGYVNGDELDNMLDDRTASIASSKSGWRGTPLYRSPVPSCGAERLVSLLMDGLELCQIGDINEHTDDGIGWGAWVAEVKAALSDAAPAVSEPAERNSAGETPTEHAHRWATELAVNMAKKFFPEVTQWKPLPDLLGVITQIDNMTCGLVRAPSEAAELPLFAANETVAAQWGVKPLTAFVKLEDVPGWKAELARMRAEAAAPSAPIEPSEVPDGVWEALQRMIEDGMRRGPGSRDDAMTVANARRRMSWVGAPIEPTPPAAPVECDACPNEPPYRTKDCPLCEFPLQRLYSGIVKAAINLLAAVDERHDNEPPLKYTIPYRAVNALRDAINAGPAAPAEPTPEQIQAAQALHEISDERIDAMVDKLGELDSFRYTPENWRAIVRAAIGGKT